MCDRRGQRPGQRDRQGAAAALGAAYPLLERVHLTDFKVRILDGASATGAVTRVLLDATDGERGWTTIGVSAEHHRGVVAGAGGELVYGLLHAPATPARREVSATTAAHLSLRSPATQAVASRSLAGAHSLARCNQFELSSHGMLISVSH